MSHTIRTLVGSGNDKSIVNLITISGADETDLVVYDNSAFINNVNKGIVMGYSISGSDSLVTLEWDQTTDSSIVSVNPVNSPKLNMSKFGGVPNPRGSGATGDVLLTTSGIGAGEIVTVFLWVLQI
jgi:hypothetical protein